MKGRRSQPEEQVHDVGSRVSESVRWFVRRHWPDEDIDTEALLSFVLEDLRRYPEWEESLQDTPVVIQRAALKRLVECCVAMRFATEIDNLLYDMPLEARSLIDKAACEDEYLRRYPGGLKFHEDGDRQLCIIPSGREVGDAVRRFPVVELVRAAKIAMEMLDQTDSRGRKPKRAPRAIANRVAGLLCSVAGRERVTKAKATEFVVDVLESAGIQCPDERTFDRDG